MQFQVSPTEYNPLKGISISVAKFHFPGTTAAVPISGVCLTLRFEFHYYELETLPHTLVVNY